MLQGRKSMVVILKVGGQVAAAECIRHAMAQQGLPWRLVHVSSLNQARLALARERADLLLIHHQLPDGTALQADLQLGDALRLLSIEQGQEALAAQALDAGFDDYVVESTHQGFAAAMVSQIRGALARRDINRTLQRQHSLLAAISRAQAALIRQTDSRAAFRSVLSELMGLTHSAVGFICDVAPAPSGEPRLHMQALSNTAWDASVRKTLEDAVASQALPAGDGSPLAQAVQGAQAVVVNQPQTPEQRRWAVPLGLPALSSYVLLPVGEPGQLLAVVCLGNRSGGYAETLLDFVKPLVDTVGQQVEFSRTEYRRQEAARVLQTTLDSISEGVMMTSASGHCVLCNARALALLDLPAELLARQPHYMEIYWLQMARNDFGPNAEWIEDVQVRGYVNNAQSNPTEARVLPPRYRRRTRDGRVLEVHCNRLPTGEELFTYTDITSAMNSQRDLQVTNERLAATLDGTRAGTWEWNLQTDEVLLNDRFASLIGYTVAELPTQVNQLYALLLHPADEELLKQASRLHISGESDHYECQFRFRHKSGHWVWLLERGRINQRNADGQPMVMSGTSIDITGSKHADDALRVTSELLKERTAALETTLHAMSQGLMVVGADGRVKLYNDQVCRILDMPDSLMATMPMLVDLVRRQTQRGDFGPGLKLVHPDAREYVQSGSGAIDDTVPRRYVRRTLKGRYLEIKSDPLPGGGFVRTYADVTPFIEAVDAARERGEEVRQLNETLEQRVAQRTLELERTMHDVETLSYSIAHDLRGPLRAVNGFAALIAADEADRLSPDGRELFARITEASRRMGVMITDLLQLFKVVRADLTPVEVDLAAMAQDAVRSLAAAYPNAQVDIEPMPRAQGDASLLRLLMFNLIDNALKYSAKAAQPRITVGWSDDVAAWFVRDNGVGFDMAHTEKLFGLFQRLHSPADFDGSGVGLAVVARVVERHGGRVWTDSRPGQGATFWFSLNLDASHVRLAKPAPVASLPVQAGQPGLFDA